MELFKLFGTIAVNNESANSAIDETTDKAEKSHGGISSAFQKVGSAAVKVGKVVATGLGVAATAIGVVAKQSLDSYAEYEQLVGGVDTLFKESSARVQEYAAMAYKTASMSANDYMSTVTSFSASLLQGLEGDTAKAADIADMAIQDMSDNANKMGTDMAAIQNAYQGFAKQNYTMLDNLKLGYGGTKTEMQRLLADAQKLTGIKYDINNLSDVYSAIHAIQVEMDIYGTTAKEASTTIQGSFAATKAAWQNLLVGFADDSADIGTLVNNLVASGTNALNNIIPRITQIFSGISEFIAQAIPVIVTELPAMLQALLPGLVQGAVGLVNGLLLALPDLMAIILEQIPLLVTQLAQGLVQAFPALLETVTMLFAQIWDWIAGGLLGLETDFDTCFAKIEELFSVLWEWLRGVWENVGKPIFSGIIDFIAGVFSGNWEQAWEGIKSIFKGILNGIITGAETMVNGVIKGLNALIEAINDISIVEAISEALGIDGIPTIPTVSLPRLEQGGILERGQVGLLEGNGAEAVVPLDQNKKWISAVAQDMDAAVGGGGRELREMKEAFADFVDALPDMLVDAFASMKFDVNNREFARLVKAVN